MNSTTVWLDIANIVTSIATFGALIAVVIEIRNSKNADKRSVSFELLEKFFVARRGFDVLNQLEMDNLDSFLEEYPAGSKEYAALIDISNFFETVGKACFNELIDLEDAIEEYGQVALGFWPYFKTIADAFREQEGYSNAFAYFEWFGLQSIKNQKDIGLKVLNELESLRKEIPV
jgi:hypothetical protein